MRFFSTFIIYNLQCLQYNILWHVDPLLGNGSAKRHERNNSNATDWRCFLCDPVDFILSIFSIYLHFHCSLTDSLLMRLSDFLICLSTFHSTFLFHFPLCSFGDLHGSWSCLYAKVYTVETERFWSETLKHFNLGIWGCPAYPNAVSPDGFEHFFV